MKNPDTLRMICGQAEDALERTARQADLTRPGDAEQVKNLIGIIYKAEGMMEATSGYSQAGYPMPMGYSGTYDNGSSYGGRSRNQLGQYVSRSGGYSRMTMEEHLAAMEADAQNPEDRQKIAAMRQIMTAPR